MTEQNDQPPGKTPPAWVEALERSEADLAAGRLVSSEVVMQGLRKSIADMKARGAMLRFVPGAPVLR